MRLIDLLLLTTGLPTQTPFVTSVLIWISCLDSNLRQNYLFIEDIFTRMFCVLSKNPVFPSWYSTPPTLLPASPLRHSSDRVNQLEALVDSYKRKLEDLGDLRRQVRLLEERNTVYMQRTCELEEELRRANAVRNQLDTYKRQASCGLVHLLPSLRY